jgi:hypothetical protein
MIPYILIMITATQIHSIEFNSASACFENKEKLERILSTRASMVCVKK